MRANGPRYDGSRLNRQLEHDVADQGPRRAHEHEPSQPRRLDRHFDAGPDRDRALADDGSEIVRADRVPRVDADLHRLRNHQLAAGLERPVALDALGPDRHLADEGIGEGDRADGRRLRRAQRDPQRHLDLLERRRRPRRASTMRGSTVTWSRAAGVQGDAGRGDGRQQRGHRAGFGGGGRS